MRKHATECRLLCLIAFNLFAVLGYAQNSNGTLRGVIEDSTRARIAHAAIDVELSGVIQTRRVTSDAQGEFRIGDMAPGVWLVSVDSPGFARASSTVNIRV